MRFVILALLFLATPANAQTADPAFLQKAIASVIMQRNNALDAQAAAEAKLAIATDNLDKATARLKELEPKEPTK